MLDLSQYKKQYGCKAILYHVKFFIHIKKENETEIKYPYLGLMFELQKNNGDYQYWPRALMMTTMSSDRSITDFNLFLKFLKNDILPPSEYTLEIRQKLGLEIEAELKQKIIPCIVAFPPPYHTIVKKATHMAWKPALNKFNWPSDYVERFPEVRL
jgi:hypothetical protein